MASNDRISIDIAEVLQRARVWRELADQTERDGKTHPSVRAAWNALPDAYYEAVLETMKQFEAKDAAHQRVAQNMRDLAATHENMAKTFDDQDKTNAAAIMGVESV